MSEKFPSSGIDGQPDDPSAERERAARAIGEAIDDVFARFGQERVTVDEDGTQGIRFGVKLSTAVAPARVTIKQDPHSGAREAYMWLEPGKSLGTELHRYSDNPTDPSVVPTLEAYRFDDEGTKVRREAGKYHDYNADAEVVRWGGKVWLKNLQQATPDTYKPPRPSRFARLLGRTASGN